MLPSEFEMNINGINAIISTNLFCPELSDSRRTDDVQISVSELWLEWVHDFEKSQMWLLWSPHGPTACSKRRLTFYPPFEGAKFSQYLSGIRGGPDFKLEIRI
jgi:hypothetical protein